MTRAEAAEIIQQIEQTAVKISQAGSEEQEDKLYRLQQHLEDKLLDAISPALA